MAKPASHFMTLVGGLNSVNSTVYTSSLIKIGDTIRVTGTASNNSIYTVIDVVSTASTGNADGTTFTDATCDTSNGAPAVTHDANSQIVAGLSVSGTGIPAGSFVASIDSTTRFQLSKNATADGTNVTLTFGDMDIYYVLKGRILTNENGSAGSPNPAIKVIRATGDKMAALGDVDSANGVDVWSDNATTDYIGVSPGSADGWETAAINPTIQGDSAKYIYHFVDEALRVCNINEENSSMVKWYGYIQRNQFNSTKGLTFAEWQEHPNTLSSPKLATQFTYVYGHTSNDGTNRAASYYQNNRGVVSAKTKEVSSSVTNLRLTSAISSAATGLSIEDTAEVVSLDQAFVGEVITIGDALGATPTELLFCKKLAGSSANALLTYERAYGGSLDGTAPAAHSAEDTPILERGLGFNLGVSQGAGEGSWAEGTYEFHQTFVYDGNQESLPVPMGNGAATIAKFTHDQASGKAMIVSVFADRAYNGRISGGRIYTRITNTDEELILLVDIDIIKGVRTSLDGDHIAWSFDDDDGFYVSGQGPGNSVEPNLDTYTSLNGFSPDVNMVSIGGIGEIYKASVVANRRTFIANVKIRSKNGELEKYGDRLMFSEIGKFDTFLEHNFIDVSKGDYGEYVALESFADRLLAFKHNLVHIVNISNPNASGWYLEDTIKYSGVNFSFSVAKTKYGVAWISDDGCYIYDGQKVSNLVNKKIGVSKTSFTTLDKPWSSWYRGSLTLKDVMLGYDAISNSLIMLRSPNDSTTNSQEAWIYDFDSNGWTFQDNMFTDSETYTNFITDWNNNLSVGYQSGSNTVSFFKYLPIEIAKSNQRFYTKDIDFGTTSLTKKIYKVIITYKSDTVNNTPFQYAIDGKQDFSSNGGGTFVGNFVDTDDKFDVLTLTTTTPILCQSLQIRSNAFTASTGIFEINDMSIQYRVLSERAVT